MLGLLASDKISYDQQNPSAVVLPKLVAECIHIRNDPSLVDELVSRLTLECQGTVNIIVHLCQLNPPSPAESRSVNAQDVAAARLIKSLCSSHMVQEALRRNYSLFARFPSSSVIPLLADVLVEVEREVRSNNNASYVVETVRRCLISALGCDHFDDSSIQADVGGLVGALSRKLSGDNGGDLLNKVCSGLGAEWRRSLLADRSSSASYASTLVSIAREMFAHPSEMVPLTLFGSVIDGSEISLLSEPKTKRLALAVVDLLKVSLEELASNRFTSSQEPDISMFHRLSPLLLLRRIPRHSYRMALLDPETQDSAITQLGILSSEMAARLDVRSPSEGDERFFTSEERRLAAEIVALALPFGSKTAPGCTGELTRGCSSFDTICLPAFESLRSRLRTSETAANNLIASIRSARAALYSVCCVLPFAEDGDGGLALLGVASFVLEILSVGHRVEDMSQDTVDEFGKLQAGCIDFLSVCLRRLYERPRADVDNDTLCATLSATNDHQVFEDPSLIQAAKVISAMLHDIVFTGRTGVKVCSGGDYGIHDPSREQPYSVEARICIWNSFILFSQRCEATVLDRHAESTLDWVVRWSTAAGDHVDDSLRHPLCIAAALKLVLTIVTRLSKTNPNLVIGKESEKSTLSKDIYRLALRTVKRDFTKYDVYSSHTVRSVALKLLLLILSVESSFCADVGRTTPDGTATSLTNQEIADALSVLGDIANKDSDQELRQFARQMIGLLRG